MPLVWSVSYLTCYEWHMRYDKHSQNFIRNSLLVDKLIKKTDINSSDTVLEIGSGTGVITERLRKVAGKVMSIEKDKKLYGISKKKLERFNNLKLINNDFLQYRLPKKKYKCFSNIPFNFTADIIRKLLINPNAPMSAYLFMQKEAAERYIGKSNVTQISLLIRPIFKSKVIYKFNRDDFNPIPSVDVVLVTFIKRSTPDIHKQNYNLYKDFITFCFNQWKRNVKYALKQVFSYEQLKRLSKELDFNLTDKPSYLSYEQWLSIFNFTIKHKDQVNKVFNEFYRILINKHKYRKANYRNAVK